MAREAEINIPNRQGMPKAYAPQNETAANPCGCKKCEDINKDDEKLFASSKNSGTREAEANIPNRQGPPKVYALRFSAAEKNSGAFSNEMRAACWGWTERYFRASAALLTQAMAFRLRG